MNTIVITPIRSSSKPLLRTVKYGFARKANYAALEEEIKQCYDRTELVKVDPFPVPKDNDDTLISKGIRTFILSCSHAKVNSDVIAQGHDNDVNATETKRLLFSSTISRWVDIPT